jgi:hypothetical protein
MTSRTKIQTCIDRQRKIEGDSADLRLVEKISRLPGITARDWERLIAVKFHRYGESVCQAHRFYYPSLLTRQVMELGRETESEGEQQ